jgi:hypothetical protein
MFKVALSVQTSDISLTKSRQLVTALNRQLREHFEPAWHIRAAVSLVVGPLDPDDLPFDAVLVIKDKADVPGALGYHDRIASSGLPVGFVFQDICQELGEPISVTTSHELLEIVLNAHINNYAVGPHPLERRRFVWHWKEACDAVQDQTYTIGKFSVSDFVLPLFFTPEREVDEKVNFLNTVSLRSFDCTAGGYLGFYDPKTGQTETFFKSEVGRKRSEIKAKMKNMRRKDKVSRIISLV